ncbi:MAG: adenylate/guanylate cyclase domain-containing protein [Ginsengibacter sp.]
MKKLFVCILPMLLIVTIQNTSAQKQGRALIDSILKELPEKKEDTPKVKLLNRLGEECLNIGEFDTGLVYCNRALSLSEKLDFKKGASVAHLIMGLIRTNQGNYNEALKHNEIARKIKEEINDQDGLAAIYNNFGIVYQNQGNYKGALEVYYKALKINEALGNKDWVMANYNNIGIIYFTQKKYPEALKSFNAALKMAEQIGDRFSTNHPYNNIGGVYFEEGKYAEALKNYETAYKIRLEMGDKFEIANSLLNIAATNVHLNNYKLAEEKYLESFRISSEIGHKTGIASFYNETGRLYITLKKYSESKSNLEKGLALNKEIGNADGIKEAYRSFAELDSATGNYKGALENYKNYIFYKDSLINKENSDQLVEQQMQYDFDKKEAVGKAEQEKKDALALKELQKQKLVRNGFVGGFTVVLLFAGVFFTQRNKIKKGKKRSDELLLNILPAEVAEELKTTGATTAKDFSEVTVLFTDFKNFTMMSEQLTAQELVNEINYCYSAFDKIITKQGIEKIKTIGDSYMCAGGLPVANMTNAVDTVRAAIEIRDFMLNEKEKRETEGKPVFEIRIGCNTGPVVAGIVGIKKFAYDIWGDTVNIASRMESSGEAGKVNISGSTYELVKDIFTCTYRGKIQAKNKGEIDMYFVK